MKKFLPLLALVLAMDAQACSLSRATPNNEIARLLRENGWGATKFKTVCEKVTRANAELLVDGNATVLGGASIGWAIVMLKDKNSNITTSDFASSSTYVNTRNVGMNVSSNLLYSALNDAVDAYDVDAAISSLDEARSKTRAALAAKAGKK